MQSLVIDFDSVNLTYFGLEPSGDVAEGISEYIAMGSHV